LIGNGKNALGDEASIHGGGSDGGRSRRLGGYHAVALTVATARLLEAQVTVL